MTVMAVWAAVLIAYGVSAANIMSRSNQQDDKPVIPLGMVENSVDDMYSGCNDEMMKTVKDKYFEKEKQAFPKAWNNAKVSAKNKIKDKEDVALTEDHMQAICAYTDNDTYTMFNEAVRTKRPVYGSSFKFHSLHFLLTTAIQILNSNYYCQTVYRRTRRKFSGDVNQIIRFGHFASSSKRTDLGETFGRETCFKIKTCSGAFLKHYSCFSDEEEVLIPPYETFKITEKIDDQVGIQGLKDCKVVYVLESAGGKSNLNCNAM